MKAPSAQSGRPARDGRSRAQGLNVERKSSFGFSHCEIRYELRTAKQRGCDDKAGDAARFEISREVRPGDEAILSVALSACEEGLRFGRHHSGQDDRHQPSSCGMARRIGGSLKAMTKGRDGRGAAESFCHI